MMSTRTPCASRSRARRWMHVAVAATLVVGLAGCSGPSAPTKAASTSPTSVASTPPAPVVASQAARDPEPRVVADAVVTKPVPAPAPVLVQPATAAATPPIAQTPAASTNAAKPAVAQTPAAAPSTVPADTKPAAPAAAAKPAPGLPPIMPFDEAIQFAAKNLFNSAQLPSSEAAARFPLTIDPLIDGNTGVRTLATESMGQRIATLVKADFPRYDLLPFNTASLARGPLLFIGTFTAVDKDGKNAGARDWYRVCLALLDVRSGKIVSKGFARASMEGVDHTPTAFFLDSPAWAPDPATQGYVRTCQGTKAGEPINPAYWDKIVAAALINDAMNAYVEGRYEDSLDLYRGVMRTKEGDQLRVHNGVYLSSWKLKKIDEATQAFQRIVDFGLTHNQLSVMFLFRPGSTLFVTDPQISGPYHMWLKQIAGRAAQRTACIDVVGHTSRTGPEPLNERLSLLRAQYVKQRLEGDSAQMRRKITASGKGSRENLSGLGTDDRRDALDRRVEFKVTDC